MTIFSPNPLKITTTHQKGEMTKINKCFPMEGKVWNSEGHRDMAKHSHVFNVLLFESSLKKLKDLFV
jgi:hypothetical protein